MILIEEDKRLDAVAAYLLLHRGQTCTGGEISRAIGITRAMVWKYIHKFMQLPEWQIEASERSGYRLIHAPDELNPVLIRQMIDVGFRVPILHLERIGSTNDELRKMALQGAQDGTLLMAEEQTAGRGRFQRRWISPYRQNIYLSILLRSIQWVRDIPRISMLFALAVCRVLQRADVGNVQIKWPNDIFLNGRKCAGILCDIGATVEQIDYLIAGIGINVNIPIFPAEIEKQATSLKRESGKDVDRATLVADVYNEIYGLIGQYKQKGDFDALHREYCQNCFVIGQHVQIQNANFAYYGWVEQIDQSGILFLCQKDGTKKKFLSGDVSLRIAEAGKEKP